MRARRERRGESVQTANTLALEIRVPIVAVEQNRTHPGCCTSRNIPLEIVANERTSVIRDAQSVASGLEDPSRRLAPTHIPTKNNDVHPLCETQPAQLFAPQLRRAAPGRVGHDRRAVTLRPQRLPRSYASPRTTVRPRISAQGSIRKGIHQDQPSRWPGSRKSGQVDRPLERTESQPLPGSRRQPVASRRRARRPAGPRTEASLVCGSLRAREWDQSLRDGSTPPTCYQDRRGLPPSFPRLSAWWRSIPPQSRPRTPISPRQRKRLKAIDHASCYDVNWWPGVTRRWGGPRSGARRRILRGRETLGFAVPKPFVASSTVAGSAQ